MFIFFLSNLMQVCMFSIEYLGTNYPLLYKLRYVQATGARYKGRGRVVRNLARGR